MPKLYEYLGIVVFFHSNEHEPIHVHGRHQDRESKAEIIVQEGKVVDIRIVRTRAKPLARSQLKDFEALVRHYADEIVRNWIDYFVLHKKNQSQKDYRENKMNDTDTNFIELTDVQYQHEYKLQLTFNDGKQRLVDFEPFLRATRHPAIREYLNLEKFRRFTFEHGYFHWNDYDLNFSLDDLYRGEIR